jgi:hypothetical protein
MQLERDILLYTVKFHKMDKIIVQSATVLKNCLDI